MRTPPNMLVSPLLWLLLWCYCAGSAGFDAAGVSVTVLDLQLSMNHFPDAQVSALHRYCPVMLPQNSLCSSDVWDPVPFDCIKWTSIVQSKRRCCICTSPLFLCIQTSLIQASCSCQSSGKCKELCLTGVAGFTRERWGKQTEKQHLNNSG